MNNWIWLIALPLGTSPLIYFFGRIYDHLTGENKPCTAARWASLLVLLATWVPFVKDFMVYQATVISPSPISLA